MLIIALVLAVIGLAALVTAVVTSNELIAWVCIVASVVGVVLLIVDALRERSRADATDDDEAQEWSESSDSEFDADYPDEAPFDEPDADSDVDTSVAPVEQHDDEVAGEERNR